MASNDHTIIEAVSVGDGDAGRVVGLSLRALRHASGLTQLEMAKRLGVGRAAVSKIEQRGDVQISSLQRYVEALGARLRIDASFPSDIALASSALQLFSGYFDADQYVLPIFRTERSPRRDVVLSIKPTYSEKIFEGVKTVELRRRFPLSIMQGSIAYIYSTSPVRALVGAAEIIDVERLPIGALWLRHGKSASIRKPDFDSYFDGIAEGYALKIAKARPFSRPLNLGELRERFGFKAPQSFLYITPDLQRALQNEHSDLSN